MSQTKEYGGVVIPMVTPLTAGLDVDEVAVCRIIDSFVDSGVIPFVLGSTGESPSLTPYQRSSMVETAVRSLNGRGKIYAGISGNCLQESVAEGRLYVGVGADVLVATPPAYYPMNDRQMLLYFRQLADSLEKPLMIYNMPVATGHSISLEVMEQLSFHPNIVGLKDSERDESRLFRAIEMVKDRDDFAHLLGWAAMSVEALKRGSDGIVPSTGNLTPDLYARLFHAVRDGHFEEASALQKSTDYLSGLYQKGKILSEAIPALKLLMSLKGLCGPDVSPPMYRMEESDEQQYLNHMKGELTHLKILKNA